MKVKKLVLLWTCIATSFLLMFVNHAFSQGINSPSPTPTPTPSQATAPVPIIQSATETTTPTSSTDCGPRIRKSWSTFTADEKAIYLEAVNISMVRRDYLQFVEMHIESASESEAHAKGVFFFWHRMMLLGYENMLRSYGSRYACITVPYWDYVTESAQYMDNECFSIGSCSALAQDTGGTTTGSLKTINVLSQPVSNFKCVNKGILRSFCGHRTLSTSTYCGCVPRGAWHSTAYPSSANYASIYRQLFPQGSSTANVNIVDFTTKVLAGVHNEMHSALKGVMSLFRAPADPIFFSHHATLDLLHTIHVKCQVGEKLLPLIDRVNNPSLWLNSFSKTGKALYPDSKITMRVQRANGPAQVHDNLSGNDLFPFFKDLPQTYAPYTDTRDLGAFSYNYELNGLLANLYTNCAAATQTTSTSSIATGAVLESEDMMKKSRKRKKKSKRAQRDGSYMRPILKPLDPTCNHLRRWSVTARKEAFYSTFNSTESDEQMELMMCKFYDECLGKIRDYTREFRKNFQVKGSPRCYTLLRSLKSKKKKIKVHRWRSIMYQFYDCPAEGKTQFLEAMERE